MPNFPELRELADLCDGVNLLGLLAFYCPEEVDWTLIASNEPFSMADCLYNLEMVQKFCAESLPYNIFHLGLEDMVYMHRFVDIILLLLVAGVPTNIPEVVRSSLCVAVFCFVVRPPDQLGEAERADVPGRFVLHPGDPPSQVRPTAGINSRPVPHHRRFAQFYFSYPKPLWWW